MLQQEKPGCITPAAPLHSRGCSVIPLVLYSNQPGREHPNVAVPVHRDSIYTHPGASRTRPRPTHRHKWPELERIIGNSRLYSLPVPVGNQTVGQPPQKNTFGFTSFSLYLRGAHKYFGTAGSRHEGSHLHPACPRGYLRVSRQSLTVRAICVCTRGRKRSVSQINIEPCGRLHV